MMDAIVHYFDVNSDAGWRKQPLLLFMDMWRRKTDEQWFLATFPRSEKTVPKILKSCRYSL